MDKPRIWTPSFIILTCANFVSALGFYFLMIKMVEYAYVTYGVSESAAGATISIYVIAALITRLVLGNKIDRWGIKRCLYLGFGVNTIAALLYLIPSSFGILLVVRALHGFGFAFASGACSSAAAIMLPLERRGEGIGYFSMAQALATGIGPFAAILITSLNGNYNILFMITVIATALATIGIVFVKVPSVEQAATQEKKGFSFSNYVYTPALCFCAAVILAFLSYSGVVSFMTMYSAESNLVTASSFYFVIYAVVILITRPITGRYVDKGNPDKINYLALSAVVVGMLCMWLAGPLAVRVSQGAGAAVLLLSALVLGFGIGNMQSVTMAIITKISPNNEMGKANSTFLMSLDLGSGIGPVLIGLFVPTLGYSKCYLALAGTALLALVIYYLFCKGKYLQTPQEKANKN